MQDNMQDTSIPLLDCPKDYLIGDASGKIMNEYGRFPCKIQCTVFAILARGSAKATINVTQYDFHANDALLLESGSFLLIHEFSDDALVYYVLFSSSFMEKNTFQTRLTANAMHMHSPIVTLTQEQSGGFVAGEMVEAQVNWMDGDNRDASTIGAVPWTRNLLAEVMEVEE